VDGLDRTVKELTGPKGLCWERTGADRLGMAELAATGEERTGQAPTRPGKDQARNVMAGSGRKGGEMSCWDGLGVKRSGSAGWDWHCSDGH
jgi:hypothetical protein